MHAPCQVVPPHAAGGEGQALAEHATVGAPRQGSRFPVTELLDPRPATGVSSGPGTPLLLPSWIPYVAAGAALAAGMAAVLWTAAHVEADPLLHEVALFVHLGCLVVGFGAVIAVDWVALLWVLGRRGLIDVLDVAGYVHVPIWIGYAGLVLSGVLLSPDLASPLTQLKLALVLVIGLNGVVATGLRRQLGERLTRRLFLVAGACASLSQVAWWSAAVIGFLNTR